MQEASAKTAPGATLWANVFGELRLAKADGDHVALHNKRAMPILIVGLIAVSVNPRLVPS